MQPRARLLGGELCVDVEPDLPDVFVDDAQISQVLVILLNNALDATGACARVLIRARLAHGGAADGRGSKSDPPPAPFVSFDVCDDGPGVPPENRERIFDPFFTTTASGTGLGLAIAQQLATENGATIKLSTAAGPTTFSVIVPVAGTEVLPLSSR
jgi:two-component system nitrogen regulation sensor histidine kinase GlnL